MIKLKRAYEPASDQDGQRILVDRLWPRGVSKANARIDRWAKELAPSTEQRKWIAHDPEKWEEFQRRYKEEIAARTDAIKEIAGEAGSGVVTLVFAAKDELHNEAVVLRDLIDTVIR